MSHIRIALVCALCGAGLPAFAQDAPTAWELPGFAMPESVVWSADADLFYVSNMGADPMAKDGDGTIATVDASGHLVQMDFATGLDAPKGMGIVGGLLYVADIDHVAAIDLSTGAVTATYGGEGVVFLNDVAIGPDGTVYVSDTFGNAVFKVEGDGLALVARDPGLSGANGLLPWGDDKLLVANLGDVSQGFENIVPGWTVVLDLADGTIAPFGATEPHILDGIAADGAGGVILSDNAAGTILRQTPGEAPTVIATLASGAADLDYDTASGLIVVPITPEGRLVAVTWAP